MQLKNLIIDSKSAWVDFPGMPGFSIEVVNLSRKELQGLRKRCTTQKLDRKTRQMEEVLDEEKFVIEFTAATVKNWKGLKLEFLQDLLLVDLKDQDSKKELEFSEENAQVLVENSTEFDNWLNEVVFDLENFRTNNEGKVKGTPSPVSG